jgi:hypothetical protein
MPAALVHLDEVKISEHPAIISHTKFRNHLSEDPGLIIMPASFANETVVNQNLLLREPPTMARTNRSPNGLTDSSKTPSPIAISLSAAKRRT